MAVRRVAALYDIHGNLPALEAVLEEVGRADVDEIVVGGDVFPGPMSRQCLELLLALDRPARFVRGNGERALLELARGGEPEGVPEAFREPMRWEARQLDADQLDAIAAWPATVKDDLAGSGTTLFCHATPRSDTELFTRETAGERVAEMLAGAGAAMVVCGHTHMQFDRRIDDVRVVNAGSVGMPFGEPGAYWLLLGSEVELRRTDYDLDEAARRIAETGHPRAQDFAQRNVLRPPTERQMLDLYNRAGDGAS